MVFRFLRLDQRSRLFYGAAGGWAVVATPEAGAGVVVEVVEVVAAAGFVAAVVVAGALPLVVPVV